MAEFHFYPTIEVDGDGKSEVLENAGYEEDPWVFYYRNEEGMTRQLALKKGVPSLVDEEHDLWDLEQHGLGVRTAIRFAYPKRLKGAGGILCRKAEPGAVIIWVNDSLKQMGYIYPASISCTETELTFSFDSYFQPGMITKDVSLEMILYVKTPAEEIESDEQHLMNEAGVSLGTLRELSLSFKDNYASFPIKQFKSEKDPLWYLQINAWEDPAEDLFAEENVCIYLNSAYKTCPTPDTMKTKANGDMLVQIFASAYLMLFHNLTEQQMHSVLNDDGTFTAGSISAALAYIYSVMDEESKGKFDTLRMEEQYTALQNTLRKLLFKSEAVAHPKEVKNQ